MKLCKLLLVSGVAIATAVFPAMAQQAQQPSTEDHSAHHGGTDQQAGQPSPEGGKMGGMMGQGRGMKGMQGMMGGGHQGMMGADMQGMQGGMMGHGGPGMMMGGCPMMGGMMGQGGPGMMGHGMMGGSPMMGSSMQSMQGGMMSQGMTGCPWCGPGMMGWGYATPQPSVNLSVNDVKSFLDRWVAGNPNIKVAKVVEQDTNTIAADIVTRDKDGLVQRYSFDRQTGLYRPVQ